MCRILLDKQKKTNISKMEKNSTKKWSVKFYVKSQNAVFSALTYANTVKVGLFARICLRQ